MAGARRPVNGVGRIKSEFVNDALVRRNDLRKMRLQRRGWLISVLLNQLAFHVFSLLTVSTGESVLLLPSLLFAFLWGASGLAYWGLTQRIEKHLGGAVVGRAIALGVIAFIVLSGFLWGVWSQGAEERQRRKVRSADLVLKDEIERAAMDNYRQLTQTIGLLERILEADRDFPALSTAHRDEALMAVRRFQRGLPGGGERK